MSLPVLPELLPQACTDKYAEGQGHLASGHRTVRLRE
jgi:hypothetical protein